MDEDLSRPAAAALANSLRTLLERAGEVLADSRDNPVLRQIAEHLGRPYDEAMVVSASWPSWQHVSVHRGAAAYLASASPQAQWFGVPGMHREHNDLMSVLATSGHRSGRSGLGPPDYVSAPCGPDATEEVVGFGLVCTVCPAGSPVVVALRTASVHGPSVVSVELLATDRRDAAALMAELRRLVDANDVLRGQVLSFGQSEHYGNEMVSFLPRPEVAASDVILPEGVLAGIEGHVAAPAAQAARLRALGIHLKRGILLHGPPGTGKTHTVRYLTGRMRESTVLVLSGEALRMIVVAAALARRLAPTIVVIEDVDLIANDRSFSRSGSPLLFTLLDAMDGVAADADVTFLLTTNRVAELERALVQRPGRIDLAVEIPLPDAAGRLRLLRLYAGHARVDADLAPVVEATAGATASAMKELMRRAVLAALAANPGADPPIVDEPVLAAVVERFVADGEALTRSLLGAGDLEGAAGSPDGGEPAEGGPHPAAFGWVSYRPPHYS